MSWPLIIAAGVCAAISLGLYADSLAKPLALYRSAQQELWWAVIFLMAAVLLALASEGTGA